MNRMWLFLFLLLPPLRAHAQVGSLPHETLLARIDTSVIKESITKSPDGRVIAFVGRIYHRQFVAINGKQSQSYERVGAKGVVFSPDSKHYAYLVKEEDDFQVVLDGAPQRGYSGIGSVPVFSPDSKHLAYVAIR